MSTQPADFAVFGTTLLARLVAGLLASRHGKKVVVVGEVKARYRLPRAADVSLAAVTRPQTWALLQALTPETTRLVGKIGGRAAHRRVDPILIAESPSAREALGHIANMARAYGIVIEPLPAKLLGSDRLAVRVSDAVAINRSVLEPALETWLSDCGVDVLATPTIGFSENGEATLRQGEIDIIARQSVLADDAAIADYLPRPSWPAGLVERPFATVLTASGKHLASPIMAHLDTGTWLVEHEEGGMAAIGPGELARFSQNLVALLNQPTQLQQVGQVAFPVLAMRDNAPLAGRDAASGLTFLAGLEGWGLFCAPALARWLADVASPQEAAWIGSHGPARTSPVAEFGALAGEFAA